MPGGETAESDPARPDPVSLLVRRILPIVGVVAILVAVTRNAARPLTNTDTYFHLRFGREFLDDWSVSDPGHVSTVGQTDWIPTQWLSQVTMAQVEDWGGLAAVAWLTGVLQITLVLTVFFVCRQWSSALAAAVSTVFVILASIQALSARPQIISYAFVILVTHAWLRTAEDRRPRWWLIALAWAWPLLHGMWPVGILIGLVALFGMVLDGERDRGLLVRLGGIIAASVVVSAANPIGPAIYESIVAVGSRSGYLAEWAPPTLTNPLVLVLLAGLAALVLIRLRTGGSSWIEALMIALAVLWAIYALRTTPVAAMMAGPLLARALQQLLPEGAPLSRLEGRTILVAGAACAATLAVVVPHTATGAPDECSAESELLEGLPPGTRVLNDWGCGGYLMWRYPQLDLVMHGYVDTFTPEQLERNSDMTLAAPRWQELVRNTEAQFALLDPELPLAWGLQTEGWVELDTDHDLVLLRAPRGDGR